MPFLQKLASSHRRSTRRQQAVAGGRRDKENAASRPADELYRQHLYSEILRISREGYEQGLVFLDATRYDEARECFEAALEARLVLDGPESESVLDARVMLCRIAKLQGDKMKAAHHHSKIASIQSRIMMKRIQEDNAHDTIDSSVLCRE